MKSLKKVGCILAATLALGACSNDEPVITDSADNIITINALHPSAVSRVNDTGFDANDRIGLFVVDTSSLLQPGGNMVNNGCFEYNGSAWTPERKYFWNEGTYNVYAYYPYSAKVEDTENYSFTVAADQSTDAGFSASDFLWAKAEEQTAGTDAVKLQFAHSFSNVVVELAKSDDYDGELPKDFEVYIHGIYTTANIDLSNGGAIADSRSALSSIKAKKLTDTSYSAIVVPQRVDSRRPLVEVVSGNVSYIMEGTISFKPGYRHTITVTLSKSPEQVEIEIGGGISGWN